MENASNALLISGGVLIAILIIGIAVILFMNYTDFAESFDQSLSTTEIREFNQRFAKFEGREDISIQEIISLANYAIQYEANRRNAY